jgi:hypothetical protein
MRKNYYQMYAHINNSVYAHTELPDLSNRAVALSNVGNTYRIKVVKNYPEEEKLTVSILDKTVVRHGRNIFYRTNILSSAIITKDKVKCINTDSKGLYVETLNTLGINWILDVPAKILNNRIVESIVKGLCTRPEHVYKRYMQYMGIKASDRVSWKHFSQCLKSYLPLHDILSYSLSKASAIDYFAENHFSSLDSDLLTYAIKFDQTIDFRWSERRKREEHLKQIQRDSIENNKLSDSPLYTREALSLFNKYSPYELELLNTERDIFVNAQYMGNCTHRCYYPKIKRGAYILFRGKWEDEIFNIGFNVSTDGSISFDQCHGRYNSYLEYTSEIKDSMQYILQSLRLLHIDKKLFITPEYEVQEIMSTIDWDDFDIHIED